MQTQERLQELADASGNRVLTPPGEAAPLDPSGPLDPRYVGEAP